MQEIKTINLLKCIYAFEKNKLVNYFHNFTCSKQHINNVIQETSRRIIKPVYILIISLISSFLILKSKDEPNSGLYRFTLFFLGIIFLTIAEVTSVSINYFSYNKILFILMPFALTIIVYLGLLVKLNSKTLKKL